MNHNIILWLQLILKERFGHSFAIHLTHSGYELRLVDSEEGKIIFPNINPLFLESHSNGPCTHWDAESEGWNSVLGFPLPAPNAQDLPKRVVEHSADGYVIHYDILGLTYWMLNRIEEIGRTDLDNHQRFPATSSHAYQHGYLERPIVDEWLHILGQVIQKIWPTIELKKHQFIMKVSHDVDAPLLYGFKSWKQIIRMMGGHLLKRGDISAFFNTIPLKIGARSKFPQSDPYNTFDWLMDVSEQNNLKSAFYFICGGSSEKDADYNIRDPRVRALLSEIHNRGHEIGLHPSYETFQRPDLIKQEADNLFQVCKEEGIEQPEWGGRMHYLRWEHPTTLQAWEDAGLDYDTTLSYADRPGFRCGTCFEYPAFNPITKEILKIRIRPLIAMECTIIADRYMGLGYGQEALEKFQSLKDKCEKVGGIFTLLWHNSHFTKQSDVNIYCGIF